ncbi:hypothetical protein HELRODRAFT_111384, partial [Helobdella robusta]|uniref:PWWP domain-containing protein n=1 Tax=Helobdella robusta TaxID=6412 RepID=T1EFA7_HELRO
MADDEDLDFYECIRCSSAFHITGVCLASGSKYLAGQFVVCSRHFNPSPKTNPLHARFGVTWCFSCEKGGGNMLNCESCPAAYHSTCLNVAGADKKGSQQTTLTGLENWKCPDCSAGVHPLYGDIVWVKFGSYRWWPAQIYWPYEVPQNISDLPHDVGEFPVCFFGSRDYLWLNRKRVFPFKKGDKCCKDSSKRSGGKLFDKAIKEALALYNSMQSDPTQSYQQSSLLKNKRRSSKKKNNNK